MRYNATSWRSAGSGFEKRVRARWDISHKVKDMQSQAREPDYDVIIVGAGVTGIYQLKRVLDLGMRVTVLEAASDLGGTWNHNRYPGARFDSESYTYGYSFSKELLDEWHWKERFSSQPENLRYLNFVADKFSLRQYMQFNCGVESTQFDESLNLWRLAVNDGRERTCRFLILGLGLLSVPTQPRYEGAESFGGQQFHTYSWPVEPVDLTGKTVGVIGTGATGIQVIAEIADKVDKLVVFQRRPNWSVPLNNGPISAEEMADIRERYDEIFAACAKSPGGFVHRPQERGFYEASREERLALWDHLYEGPGFGLWMGNNPEIFTDEAANAELSEYIAGRIRKRVRDPALAEKLIPRDHGFGVQRVPLETRYFEVYNRPNVRLVDLSETPIERITKTGIQTFDYHYNLDLIVYATGFDAITGAFDRIDIRGVGGEKLSEKWEDGPSTCLGILIHGFPNLLMATGPQSASASANYPRGIEINVNFCTELLECMRVHGQVRVEATREAEELWTEHVKKMYSRVLMRKAKSWFTGYNSNIPGREHGKPRYFVYNGGAVLYAARLRQMVEENYNGLTFY
jgi:cation diffusion facilitator CzcD-associated flavoprotein CzcO